MYKILQIVGQIAGIGGIGIGVFLLLFRRIKLPSATRRHLTLYMWLVWSIAVLGVVSYTVGKSYATSIHLTLYMWLVWSIAVLGVVSYIVKKRFYTTSIPEKKIQIATYKGDIYLTSWYNKTFLDFLVNNVDKIVCLDAFLDASVIIERQVEFDEIHGVADLVNSCKFEGKALQLDNWGSCISFYFLKDHLLFPTYGGTGVVRSQIRGFFEVSQCVCGASTYFNLREIDTPFDIRINFLTKEI